MKSRIRYLILAGLFVFLIFVSCKTTGDATASLVEIPRDLAGPADEASLAALAKAEANAKEARSLAEYVNGPVHRPDEWILAEDRFKAVSSFDGDLTTKEEVYAKVAEWNAVNLAYYEIYKGSVDVFLGEQEAVLAQKREDAVEAGAEEIVPDRLAIADTFAAKSKELSDKKDARGSVNAGMEARDRYQILETVALARGKQVEVEEYNFLYVDPVNYELARESGNAAITLYDEGDLSGSQSAAHNALTGFTQVIRTGVEEKASVVRESREAAQDIKADVAVRSDFAAAESVYNQAHVALRADQFSEAIELFEESDALYEIAYEKALEKREIAEEALQRTEEKLAESEELAQYAEKILEGDE